MSADVSVRSPSRQVARVINSYILPLGWLVILTGMFWAWDRTLYHKLFYVLLAAPTLVALLLQPRMLKDLANNPLFMAFLVFSAYTMLTIAWSDTENSVGSLLKRPLYITMLLLSAGIIALHASVTLTQCVRLAALVAATAAGISLIYFVAVLLPAGAMRLDGFGALYNPLLTAHVLGAFAAVWLVFWFQGQRALNPVALACLFVLGAAILATGSRTPLVGLSAALGWLLIVGDRRRGLLAVGTIAIAVVAVALVYPEAITQRGVSYRPAIWMESLRQIGEHPWFGHGYDTAMTVVVPGMERTLADPHNIELGVLYAGGVVGLVLWMALYGLAMYFCWAYRKHPGVVLAGAWLVFGFASGLTEGNAFMSRPKEHWFLIWIPMALVYGQWLALGKRGQAV
ncbi:O-antigen ligase family protein [Pseudomonas sp. PSKL.D1]|uniref:O-antigen ligase family protein n=1 Tax=Pseudomonas sp. PSKL.D1 TaxID=3029060 RepID=UPI002381720E|nr:O-antigen ligase family protein [Pseudomonas sp. PSKL.D1]WDY56671.1 O-antigen ligase family protein [Pseudomonas sp. PSKL.D1]